MLSSLFVLMNIIAYFHAYSFTHFGDAAASRTERPDKLTSLEKLKVLVFGVNNPRPEYTGLPPRNYRTIRLNGRAELNCWYTGQPNVDKTGQLKDLVILFHGYGSEKSSLIEPANYFRSFGSDVLLVDFVGSGASAGNGSTIGFKEAQDVRSAVDLAVRQGHQKIFLYGNSLGAAAIMKAMKDYDLPVTALILECPFGSMYETVGQRFDNMKMPRFPMASLLVFWGGIQNGFWAFGHNPEEYAKAIKVPTLLLWGAKDKSVSQAETESIFKELNGPKRLVVYPLAGHEDYLIRYKNEWMRDVKAFMNGQQEQD